MNNIDLRYEEDEFLKRLGSIAGCDEGTARYNSFSGKCNLMRTRKEATMPLGTCASKSR